MDKDARAAAWRVINAAILASSPPSVTPEMRTDYTWYPKTSRGQQNVSRLGEALSKVQGHLCASCGMPMYGKRPPMRASVDHVVPKGKGGSNDIGNLVAMHVDCNNKKADRMPTGCERLWLEVIRAKWAEVPTKPELLALKANENGLPERIGRCAEEPLRPHFAAPLRAARS